MDGTQIDTEKEKSIFIHFFRVFRCPSVVIYLLGMAHARLDDCVSSRAGIDTEMIACAILSGTPSAPLGVNDLCSRSKALVNVLVRAKMPGCRGSNLEDALRLSIVGLRPSGGAFEGGSLKRWAESR